MPTNDREVHQHFYSRVDDPPEVAALAYAGYAKAKYDWVAHFEARESHPPTSAEVDRWIADLPASRLDDLRQDAIDFFDLAARAYMASDIERAAEAARDEAIVMEVRTAAAAITVSGERVQDRVERATSFRSTFWPNVFIGIVASFAFSFLVIAASIVFTRDPSPFALFRSIQEHATAPQQKMGR